MKENDVIPYCGSGLVRVVHLHKPPVSGHRCKTNTTTLQQRTQHRLLAPPHCSGSCRADSSATPHSGALVSVVLVCGRHGVNPPPSGPDLNGALSSSGPDLNGAMSSSGPCPLQGHVLLRPLSSSGTCPPQALVLFRDLSSSGPGPRGCGPSSSPSIRVGERKAEERGGEDEQPVSGFRPSLVVLQVGLVVYRWDRWFCRWDWCGSAGGLVVLQVGQVVLQVGLVVLLVGLVVLQVGWWDRWFCRGVVVLLVGLVVLQVGLVVL
ncbi:hypothetical protein INR49_020455 [Caranx melampygus]|nr:hypothetical protein INR49_020455 [Caranx melampygus]